VCPVLDVLFFFVPTKRKEPKEENSSPAKLSGRCASRLRLNFPNTRMPEILRNGNFRAAQPAVLTDNFDGDTDILLMVKAMSNEKKVIEIITEWYGKPTLQISKATRIFHDLHMYGDDVDELFKLLADEYILDLTSVDLTDCFPSEPHLLSGFPFDQLRSYHPLYVEDLITWIDTKKWPDVKSRPAF
jgi:hypothetical protein